MISDDAASPTLASMLRESFDHAFAMPVRADRVAKAAFLGINIESALYALPLSDVVVIEHDRKVTPFPTLDPWLLGVSAFRGTPTPIYDLRIALGHAGGAAPRWIVLVRAPSLVGLAFDHLEAQFSADVGEGSLASSHSRTRTPVEGSVRGPDAMRLVIRISSVLETIRKRLDPLQPTEGALS